MKLEHGKKYVLYNGSVVGPLIELHDGRFSWGCFIWSQTGNINLAYGRNQTEDTFYGISHEYAEMEPAAPVNPETIAEQYTHKEVGVTMTLSRLTLEEGKTYRTKAGWITGPLGTVDGKIFFPYPQDKQNTFGEPDHKWDIYGKNIKSTHGFGGPHELHDIVQEVIIPSVKPNLNRAAATFLDKVKDVVTGPREQDYGDKTENHARIARLWNMWLTETKADGDAITPYDVATMMLMVKLARLMQSPGHQDSHIDIAGYVACMEEIYDRQ